jgi:hypothetical protein
MNRIKWHAMAKKLARSWQQLGWAWAENPETIVVQLTMQPAIDWEGKNGL